MGTPLFGLVFLELLVASNRFLDGFGLCRRPGGHQDPRSMVLDYSLGSSKLMNLS